MMIDRMQEWTEKKEKVMGCPESYKVQEACFNCKYCFILYDYDSAGSLFCLFGKTEERPICGSVEMDEGFSETADGDDVEWEKNEAAWEEYVDGRAVVAHGVCDEYDGEQKEGSE